MVLFGRNRILRRHLPVGKSLERCLVLSYFILFVSLTLELMLLPDYRSFDFHLIELLSASHLR